MNLKKEPYEKAKIELILIKTEDVLSGSNVNVDGGLEWDKKDW